MQTYKWDKALKKLLNGNKRFYEENSTHPNQDKKRLAESAGSQKPFAVIIGCSDSRIPPEIIFDQGIGDLFVIRVAGNTVGNVCIGSVEYAVEHLGIELVLILGHKQCGVVKTAASGDDVHHHLAGLVETAKAAVEKARGKPGGLIDNAVKENVKLLKGKLEHADHFISDYVKEGRCKIVGAFYDLDTGVVEMLD
jgi:carbonic anhydrase